MCTHQSTHHTHTHVYTCTHTHTHMYTCIHTCTHTHTCTHAYTHAHTHTYTHIHILTHTHTHTYIHILTHTRTHTHTHTHCRDAKQYTPRGLHIPAYFCIPELHSAPIVPVNKERETNMQLNTHITNTLKARGLPSSYHQYKTKYRQKKTT